MNDAALPTSAAASGLSHMLYPYNGAEQYLSGTSAYIDQARADGGTVVVAVPDTRRTVLRERFADDASVTFVDTTAVGRNPGRLIPAWQSWIGRQAADGRPVRGISESAWSGRTRAQLSELRYHEWLLNLAFAQAPAWSLLCPYDTDGQTRETIQLVARCHPLVWQDGAAAPGLDYAEGPYRLDDMSEPPPDAPTTAYTVASLGRLRDTVSDRARERGLEQDRVRDLLVAVTEVASNSVLYGGGGGTLRTWTEDGTFLCELRDAGVFDNPLAGRVRPAPTQLGGRGLWFVHQLCDLVEIRSAAGLGTRVRLHMDLPRQAVDADGEAAADTRGPAETARRPGLDQVDVLLDAASPETDADPRGARENAEA